MKLIKSIILQLLLISQFSSVYAKEEKELIINSSYNQDKDSFNLHFYPRDFPDKIFALSFDLIFEEPNFSIESTKLNLENNADDYLFLSKINERRYSLALSSKKGKSLSLFLEKPMLEIDLKTSSKEFNPKLSNLQVFETIPAFNLGESIEQIKINQNSSGGVSSLPLAGEENLYLELKKFIISNLILFSVIFIFIKYLKIKKDSSLT